MIEGVGTSAESGRDVAQTISRGHLREDYADELLSARGMTGSLLRFPHGDDSGKRLAIDEFDYSVEHIATGGYRSEPWKIPFQSSNTLDQ